MESIGKVLAIISLAYWLMACNDPNRKVLEPWRSVAASFHQVKAVADGYNAAGQPTVFILLGSDSGNLLDLYLLRSNITEGYAVQSLRFDHPEIELRAQWNGKRFMQSTEHPTVVNLTIRSITPNDAVIEVSATLVDRVTGQYLTLPPSVVHVQGEYLTALIADQ